MIQSLANYQWNYRKPVCEFYTHFLEGSLFGFTVTTSGTSAAANTATTDTGGNPGQCQLTTGTTATGRAAITLGTIALLMGFGRCVMRSDIKPSNLSDATDTYTLRIGFLDSNSGESTDGVFFRYTHGTNSGNWECVSRSNNTETVANSSIAPDASNFQALQIDVNADATLATFLINGNLAGTITTNIPTGTNRQTGWGALISKSVGTNPRILYLDTFYAGVL